jgi:small-conductance mechanosensitive channel
MQDPMAVLEQNYITIQDQVNVLSLSCNQAERDKLNTQLLAARSAYWSCVNKAFHDDDPQVAALTAQLKQQTQSIKNAVQNMGDIAKVLDQITTAANTAANLAALVISA